MDREQVVNVLNKGVLEFGNLVISEENRLYFYFGNLKIDAKKEYLFTSLKHIRQLLEEEDIFLAINGSRKDVYPSGQSIVGQLAYVHKMGKPALLSDLVNIFDLTDELSLIGTVQEQEEYHKKWLDSLKQ